MQLSAVLLGRAIAFFEIADINPYGGVFFPDLTRELIQRFNFQKYPQTLEEWRNASGAKFEVGKLGDIAIENLILFNNGIQVDTAVGTEEARKVIELTLEWASEHFKFRYAPGVIRRWAYVSNLTFFSNVKILATPPLDRLAERVSEALSGVAGEQITYAPVTQSLAHDPLVLKFGRAHFTIQRRLDVPFSDNKYYSEAPLPTGIHRDLLGQFEADVMRAFG